MTRVTRPKKTHWESMGNAGNTREAARMTAPHLEMLEMSHLINDTWTDYAKANKITARGGDKKTGKSWAVTQREWFDKNFADDEDAPFIFK